VERNTALDRFHFHDPRSVSLSSPLPILTLTLLCVLVSGLAAADRTEEELKAEKEIASRLKKAYRAAKAMVNKKKEKERERYAPTLPSPPLLCSL
jgi:hypothetical protein